MNSSPSFCVCFVHMSPHVDVYLMYCCSHGGPCLMACVLLQEEMYSYVTVADDQTTKGKGVTIVEDN